MRKGHIESISTFMKERNIPAYENGDYVAIARPTTYVTLKSDLEGIQTYTETGLIQIKNGEIGRYRCVRFIEQTHIPAGGAYDSTTYNPQTGTADAWNNGKSDWAYFMGADTVAEGVAIPEEIRGKIHLHEFNYEGKRIPVTTSLGVSELKSDTESANELIKSSDKALYTSKESGRNRVTVA
jgi:hypothetical protein